MGTAARHKNTGDNVIMHRHHDPTAVFVHGAGGGGWEWTIWRRVFAAHGWTTEAPDLVPAAAGLAATRIEDYVAQVRAWCAGCDPAPALIGASLGGLLALTAATQITPAALVLVNPLPPAGIEPRPARADYPDIVPWGRSRSLAGTQRALPDGDDATRLFAFRRWRDESGQVLRDAHSSVDSEAPHCPVLVIASERDNDCPAPASRALATRLHADFHLLPGASHVGPLLGRDAGAIADDTRDWCSRRLDAVTRTRNPRTVNDA